MLVRRQTPRSHTVRLPYWQQKVLSISDGMGENADCVCVCVSLSLMVKFSSRELLMRASVAKNSRANVIAHNLFFRSV